MLPVVVVVETDDEGSRIPEKRQRFSEAGAGQGRGGGRVTHEPPLRMAERSPAAKQSIYAFKMAARNATHPTVSLHPT